MKHLLAYCLYAACTALLAVACSQAPERSNASRSERDTTGQQATDSIVIDKTQRYYP